MSAAATATSRTEFVDERRLVAYAAAIHDTSPALFELDRPGGVTAHPVFPVCLEYPLFEHGQPGLGMSDDDAHGGIHVSHEITWHRQLRGDQELVTTATVDLIDRRSIGAYVVTRFETTTAGGEPVVSTRQGVIYLGVELPVTEPPDGDSAFTITPPETARALREIGQFEVLPEDAAIYTECARIWNPIHTDPRVARSKGLAAPIFHGTATLARSVSVALAHHAPGAVGDVARLGCRFTAGVPAGETVTVATAYDEPGRQMHFEARLASGVPVLSDGFIALRGE